MPDLSYAELKGNLRWLSQDAHDNVDHSTAIANLLVQANAVGRRLPDDFLRFYLSSGANYALDEVSITCCWTTLANVIFPSPMGDGAYLVRFLNDQQDCATWYLYLCPNGSSFVVYSSELVTDPWWDLGGADPTQVDQHVGATKPPEITWCAPTFEEFAYRFWIENRIWRAFNTDGDVRDPELNRYLDHYREVGHDTN